MVKNKKQKLIAAYSVISEKKKQKTKMTYFSELH